VRIVVCVAAVPNPERVKWDRFRQLLDLQDAEPVLNPIDRHALEVAASLSKHVGSKFDAICAGAGASAALREAAVFGADRLVAISDDALESADEAGIASALSAAISYLGGADVVLCGDSTASFGSGAVPGYLSVHLDAGLVVDALGTEIVGGSPMVTAIGHDGLMRSPVRTPCVIVAAPYGIKVRAVSPLLLMRASKKPVESLTLDAIGCGEPLPTTGVTDGPLESDRGRKGMEVIEGDDAASRAVTLIGALRERRAV
jgi:electron transfer flavoprotein beta subunit